MSVVDLVKEICDVSRLMSVRHPLGDQDAMATAMVSGLCSKIGAIKQLKAAEGMELYSSVNATVLSTELKAKLTAAIDQVLTANLQSSATSLHTMPQTLSTPYYYLTTLDWQQLEGEVDYWSGLHVVARRLKLLGLKSMHEQTKKWFTSVLVHLLVDKTKQIPEPNWVYKLSQDLAQAFDSCATRPSNNLCGFLVYPSKPEDLGEEWLKLAYGDERPIAKDLPKLMYIFSNHVPIRSTSNLLKKQSGSFSSESQSVGRNMLQALADELRSHRGLSGLLQPDRASSINIDYFGSQSRPSQATAGSQGEVVPCQAGQANTGSQDAMVSFLAGQANTGTEVPTASVGQADGTMVLASQFQPTQKRCLRVPLGQEESKGLPIAAEESQTSEPSLESLEEKAFEQIGQSKCVKKRPAGKCEPKTIVSEPKNNDGKKLGCPRCRGSINGCDTCKKPSYRGVVLHGKAAWEKHVKSQQKKKTRMS